MLKTISGLLQILNSNKAREEIALGVILGMFGGFLLTAPFNFVIIFLFLVLINANTASFTFFLAVFKLVALAVDPIGNIIGSAVLKASALTPFFKFMSGIPFVPFTKFNNTVIMGDFIIAVVLIVPVWFLTMKMIDVYRDKFKAKVDKLKIVKILNIGDTVQGRISK
jgi:uncharacterized protein (TIGR03546 family)